MNESKRLDDLIREAIRVNPIMRTVHRMAVAERVSDEDMLKKAVLVLLGIIEKDREEQVNKIMYATRSVNYLVNPYEKSAKPIPVRNDAEIKALNEIKERFKGSMNKAFYCDSLMSNEEFNAEIEKRCSRGVSHEYKNTYDQENMAETFKGFKK